jgi:hypothetical protein
VSAINLGRHNRQIKDVRVEHLASDSIAMSGWTFSQIQNKIFFKLDLLKQVHKKLYENRNLKSRFSIIAFDHLVLSAKYKLDTYMSIVY